MHAAGDTIVAAATPPGAGGVGVVRISGPAAAAIATAMLGSVPKARHATYRRFRDATGGVVDAGIALFFPAPGSYTGEDVLELQGHGGPVVMALLVEAALALGARRAAPGEFTQRAFLNDKLDLAQAEAVVDLVASGTAAAARAALRSLEGRFSAEVEALTEALTRLRMHVEAAIDFPEEEIDFLADAELAHALERTAAQFDALLEAARAGRVLRDGYSVVIVGAPNAGKSSLMNYLSGTETAIVTEVAGTTRDILRERIDLEGLAVELVDTAGLREDPDLVEAEGIRRARAALGRADAVLWLQDASAPGPVAVDEAMPDGIPVTIVRNKIDRTGETPGAAGGEPPVIRLSARTGAGVDALKARLLELAGHRGPGEGTFTARRRHVEALEAAARHFRAGRAALRDERAGELLAEELRLAQRTLGEITGAVTADDLLGRIFAEFCIGK
ncbi:MAG: tRNA uridine-5-carboxymethylaminomethyl(34) synthesis GTPase MnmE [Woeseiaceae bacterium]|nr:tRNA uridine-5-carboxymethylaminomethyl(34) synthesis GTPase MnmE [Woeseiaceae bacterium]